MKNKYKPYFLENCEKKIDYFISLNLKQYTAYNVCENKVNILATISAIFIGATIIFIDNGKTTYQTISSGTIIFLINLSMIFMLLFFIISLAIMIWYVGPDRVINPRWVGINDTDFIPNHRAIYGIKEFKNINEYKKSILTLTQEDICDQIINQILVINKMIWKMQKVIKIAVLLNIIGLIVFIFILIAYLFGR